MLLRSQFDLNPEKGCELLFRRYNVNLCNHSYRDGALPRSVGLVGSNFANEEIHQIGVAKTVSLGSALVNSNARFISYFARVNYNFKEKYILTLTGRRDATSLFSKENRFGYFPSVGLGWRVSDEEFMENVRIISDMKLRSSWEKTGNSNIAGFSNQSTVWTGSGNSVVYPLGLLGCRGLFQLSAAHFILFLQCRGQKLDIRSVLFRAINMIK